MSLTFTEDVCARSPSNRSITPPPQKPPHHPTTSQPHNPHSDSTQLKKLEPLVPMVARLQAALDDGHVDDAGGGHGDEGSGPRGDLHPRFRQGEDPDSKVISTKEQTEARLFALRWQLQGDGTQGPPGSTAMRGAHAHAQGGAGGGRWRDDAAARLADSAELDLRGPLGEPLDEQFNGYESYVDQAVNRLRGNLETR